eukprot:1983367-Pyramimonas_sp.AAC.1
MAANAETTETVFLYHAARLPAPPAPGVTGHLRYDGAYAYNAIVTDSILVCKAAPRFTGMAT